MILVGLTGKIAGGGEVVSLFSHVSAASVSILIYLALVSSVAYTLWAILLRTNDVSKISVFGFINPAIGVILSAVLLGEKDLIGPQFFLAVVLVCIGIVIVNLKVPDPITRA